MLQELAEVYASQWDPDHVGTGDCVPTSAKMLIEYYSGRDVPIAQIRRAMDLAPDGVVNLARDAGITLEAAADALSEIYGVECAPVEARDLDFDALLELVRAGRLPIVFEQHGLLPTRQDQVFGGLHAVWLVRDNQDGTVDVKDPDRWGPNKADRWTVAAADFRAAYEAGAPAGGGAIVPMKARQEDDMFTDEDRRKLNRVYDHLEAFEPLTWFKRLQQWLAKAIRSVFPNADLSGPDVESGQPFK
jgi:hypothetical protein